MLEKGSVRVSDLVSRGSCVEVETFLRDGHPDAWWTLGLPRRQFLFLFAGTEELDFACFFLSRFKYRSGGFQRFWLLLFGCQHYRRRCQIRAPCCNEVFDCRHCHNEFTSTLRNIYDRHELVRQDVKQVICSVCDTEQPVAQVCTNCGVNMGEYFCNICKFYDDNTEKQQFHCDDCGICRVGGRENFFHCKKCGSCYATGLRNNHRCVEDSMRHHCPICYEYLFDSLKETTVMKCGHTMHCECYHEMIKRDKFCCPICSRSVIDMSKTWQRMDEEIEATSMPSDYRDKKVWILCNDCNDTTEVYFHIIGQKCGHCRSYNTRAVAPPVLPQ